MYRLLIVGAGQLGSRHLQGAIGADTDLRILVVDPSYSSLKIAKKRAEDQVVPGRNVYIEYSTELPAGESFDICIIATSADVRAEVTRQLLSTNHFRHIVFEKVLFQKLEDYSDVKSLLKRKDVSGWVNCPRRYFPTYQEIKTSLDPQIPVNLKVTGTGWGMACNSIHFIDLFSFLTDDSQIMKTGSNLSAAVIESKRAGFYEVNGSIQYQMDSNTLFIQCDNGPHVNLSVIIENGNIRYRIEETQAAVFITVNQRESKRPFKSILQSNLTGPLISDLLEKNQCHLTPFSQSCELHIPFIETILTHFSRMQGKEVNVCPIT